MTTQAIKALAAKWREINSCIHSERDYITGRKDARAECADELDALAEQMGAQGEAVAWMRKDGVILSGADVRFDGRDTTNWTPLYASPPPSRDAAPVVGEDIDATERAVQPEEDAGPEQVQRQLHMVEP